MNKRFYKFRFFGTLMILAVLAVFSALVMLLWNALVPEIFGLQAISYWQAAGILVLVRTLFGGLGDGRFIPRLGRSGGEHLFRHGNHLREKWMNMTDEERKAFVEKERDFLRTYRGFSHLREFFEDEGRGRCGGGTPAEGGSERPPEAGWSGGGDFPPHDKKGGA